MPPYLLDAWTWIHLGGWFAAAYIAVALGLRPGVAFMLAAAAGLNWEAIELVVVEPWLNFHEPWYNRWLTDIVADFLGAGLGARAAATSILLEGRYPVNRHLTVGRALRGR